MDCHQWHPEVAWHEIARELCGPGGYGFDAFGWHVPGERRACWREQRGYHIMPAGSEFLPHPLMSTAGDRSAPSVGLSPFAE